MALLIPNITVVGGGVVFDHTHAEILCVLGLGLFALFCFVLFRGQHL